LPYLSQALKECQRRNQRGDPEYRSLVDCIERRLRETVGEKHWRRAGEIQRKSLSKQPSPKRPAQKPSVSNNSGQSFQKTNSSDKPMNTGN